MSRSISKLLLSIGMIPAAFGVFWAAYDLCNEFRPLCLCDSMAFASLIALLFVYIYWTLVWRSTIRWVGRRVIGSVVAFVGSLLVGGAALGISAYFEGFCADACCGAGSLAAGTSWMIFSTLAWRQQDEERMLRLFCPKCGYVMTGLTHARCPECGTEYTLDALLAAALESTGQVSELNGSDRRLSVKRN